MPATYAPPRADVRQGLIASPDLGNAVHAEATGVSLSTVRRHRASLERGGLIPALPYAVGLDGKVRRTRNPFARDAAEAGALGCAAAYVASRELHYLAGVGAVEYLREPAALLGVEVPPIENGLVVKVARARTGSGSAFDQYARAEAVVLERLDAIPADQRHAVAQRLAVDVARCMAIRAALIARGRAVPGRGVWLTLA